MKDIGSQFGSGGSGLSDGTLATAIRELQGLKTTVVAGAAADTNIAVVGLKEGDTIQSAIRFDAGVPSDITADVEITEDAVIQSSVNTTGNTILLSYFSAP